MPLIQHLKCLFRLRYIVSGTAPRGRADIRGHQRPLGGGSVSADHEAPGQTCARSALPACAVVVNRLKHLACANGTKTERFTQKTSSMIATTKVCGRVFFRYVGVHMCVCVCFGSLLECKWATKMWSKSSGRKIK